jgi:hypothetical protein
LRALEPDAHLYSYDIRDSAAASASKYSAKYPQFHFIKKSQEMFSPEDIERRLVDFLFIDAAHRLPLNQKTFLALLPSLAENALIAVHDTGTWHRKHFLAAHANFAKRKPKHWLNSEEFQHQIGERAFVNWIANAFSDFQAIHFHSLRCLRHGITLLQRRQTLKTQIDAHAKVRDCGTV